MLKKIKYYQLVIFGVFILIMPYLFSCTHTRLLNLSKKEISELDTVYNQVLSGKLFDTEWVFYEKQICQMKIKFVSTKVYTGTWAEKNDTIHVNFFYGDKIAKERKLLINNENGKIIELYNE